MAAVVLITGASRGIGEAIARRLARRDRQLVLVARSGDVLRRLCAELGGDRRNPVDFLQADLSTSKAARSVARRVEERHGPVEQLILNAGQSNNRLFREARVADLERELGINYVAPLALVHALLPGMLKRRRGRIVAVGSLTSLVPFPGNASYAASKAALLTLMRSLAIELRRSGVRVSTVLPGLTRTQMSEELGGVLPALDPDDVARAVQSVLRSGAPLAVPGLENKIAAALFRTMPGSLDRTVGWLGRHVVPGYGKALARSRDA